MAFNVVTIMEGKDERFIDRVILFSVRRGVIRIVDTWVIEDRHGNEVGYFATIEGSKWFVDLLSVASDCKTPESEKTSNQIYVTNDEKTGELIEIKRPK